MTQLESQLEVQVDDGTLICSRSREKWKIITFLKWFVIAGPVMDRFTSCLRDIASFKEVLKTQVRLNFKWRFWCYKVSPFTYGFCNSGGAHVSWPFEFYCKRGVKFREGRTAFKFPIEVSNESQNLIKISNSTSRNCKSRTLVFTSNSKKFSWFSLQQEARKRFDKASHLYDVVRKKTFRSQEIPPIQLP